MKKTTLFIVVMVALANMVFASQVVEYNDSWSNAGFSLEQRNSSGVTVNYSIKEFSLTDIRINGENMVNVLLPDVLLQNDEGAPNLAGGGRLIALPQGAYAKLNIISQRTEIFLNVEIAPAPRIPLDTDDSPLEYSRNQAVYSKDAFYPASPVTLDKQTQMRGVDVVMLGITPFQYNPVTKELIVYRDLQVEVEFVGGNGHFGADNLRSRWWDPILSDHILNYESLPTMDYTSNFRTRDGAEYLIICPDDATFLAWADSIKVFRTKQGIPTVVMTTAEVGGNTVSAIEGYIDDIMDPSTGWDPAPAAILLLGDYGTTGNTVVSPIYNNYCVSDNIFADVSGNMMPDVTLARMTAQNATQLEVMITKFLDYERTPPTNPDFYDHPITALGYQTERWFQICSEAVAGFWEVNQGKTVNRVNAIYSGNPVTGPWSTATNTATVLNVFGPNGLGYIPATPGEVNCTWYGNANDVINGINDGAFMLQHRDHGSNTGWGEPGFQSSHINSLNNTDLPFIFSINCLTGKFNLAGECFAETFHRYTNTGENSGCLGIIAASEVSYSFVNDTFVWGMYDNMWPDFLPDYGTTPDSRDVLPAFANSAGKYFLQQSSWPYNTNNKAVTYALFHHHGDAFTTVYSEVPQDLTVVHDPVLMSGFSSFNVTANVGALIALSVNGELIGVADGTGSPVSITIDPQISPTIVDLVITMQNYYRYEVEIPVIPTDGPYVVYDSHIINDASGNGNGMLDYGEIVTLDFTVYNVGSEQANNVDVTISTTDDYVTITDATAYFGNITAGATVTVDDAFGLEVANDVPDGHVINFVVEANGGEIWESDFSDELHAPILTAEEYIIDDATGNNNGIIDPGETVTFYIPTNNEGSSDSPSAIGTLTSTEPLITIVDETYTLGEIAAGSSVDAIYTVTADSEISLGTPITFNYEVDADAYSIQNYFTTIVGLIVEDFESNNFLNFDWQFSGNADWLISTDAYEGFYSATSGNIADNQTSSIYLEVNVLAAGELTFYKKVSSEGSWDYLRFFIDNSEMDSWSGTVPWGQETYQLSAGTHTLKWEYDKDGSVSSGSDCAWIDYIVFPAIAFVPPLNSPENVEAAIVDFNDVVITWEAPEELMSENETIGKVGKIVIGQRTSGTNEVPVSDTRSLTGFKVYEGGNEIVEITDPSTLTYTDEAIDAGDYVYTVTAIYDDGESYPSDPANVTVELPAPTDVTAASQDPDVIVSWIEPTRGIVSYNVYRNTELIAEDVMSSPYEDLNVPSGNYTYNVTTIYDGDWESEMSNGAFVAHTDVDNLLKPEVTELTGNYPNPFNPTTTISFSTNEAGYVSINIYNMKGQLVKTLVNEYLDAAFHNVSWNGKDNSSKTVSSGIYFYKMKSSSYTSTKKMILMK
ncbi:MAG: T9SS type A sorting domain-containing protein [Candidatus Cloacimonetes bacterium]|nr:T9SS type A sorting domain-containing protein [Candidatus Cloacimonadota bacterium]